MKEYSLKVFLIQKLILKVREDGQQMVEEVTLIGMVHHCEKSKI